MLVDKYNPNDHPHDMTPMVPSPLDDPRDDDKDSRADDHKRAAGDGGTSTPLVIITRGCIIQLPSIHLGIDISLLTRCTFSLPFSISTLVHTLNKRSGEWVVRLGHSRQN